MQAKRGGKHEPNKNQLAETTSFVDVLAKTLFIILVLTLTVMAPIVIYTQFLISTISLVAYVPPTNVTNTTQSNSTINFTLNTSLKLRTAVPPGARFIRIKAIENGAWELANPQYGYSYTAQDVLAMISQLQPSVLERYISGPVSDPNAPIYSGGPSIANFLNQSMAACSGCTIVARIDLAGGYDPAKAASTLYNLPLAQHLQYLSIDNWGPWARSHSKSDRDNLFKALYAEGWKGIAVNECGGYVSSDNYATFADSCVSDGGSTWQNWQINTNMLSQIRNSQTDKNIQLVLLYIDFGTPHSGEMYDFDTKLSPDSQANVLTYNIASQQSNYNVDYVYPIVQEFWNANLHTTSHNGPYGGQTLYRVMLWLMNQYNPANGNEISCSYQGNCNNHIPSSNWSCVGQNPSCGTNNCGPNANGQTGDCSSGTQENCAVQYC